MNSKPRVLRTFENLDVEIQEQIKLAHPFGFEDNLIKIQNKEGDWSSALPFETEERHYLVKMTLAEAEQIVAEDEDYDGEGRLLDEIREEYEGKYD